MGVGCADVSARARAGASRRDGCGLCGTDAGTPLRESGGLPGRRGWAAGKPWGDGRASWPVVLGGAGGGGRGEGTIGGRTTDRASSWPVGGGPVTHQLAAGPLVGGGLVARQRWSRTASNPKRAAGGSQGEKKGKCICVE